VSLFAQPFDTIKVRLQTQGQKYQNAMDCFRKTTKGEGFWALFKGMAPPLATAAAVNAIVFASFGYTLRVSLMVFVFVFFPSGESVAELSGSFGLEIQLFVQDQSGPPTYGQMFLAGSCAGLVQVGVLCPTELIKCRLQVCEQE
jgi:hypothetical protein